MKHHTISADDLNLANILRERIDECAKYKRNVKISKELSEGCLDNNRILSKEELKQIDDALFSRALGLFLDAKESLIIPDDGLHQFASEILSDFEDFDIELAYQDFYAYQYVDKLDDVVRRALKVREIFTQNRPPAKVITICREAYTCFLQGFHTASVTLIRAIIESVLKDKLNEDIGGLGKLNHEAYEKKGLYSKQVYHKINKIRREGNIYIHGARLGKTPSEAVNFELLNISQEILKEILL